jgi:hypothetical protein
VGQIENYSGLVYYSFGYIINKESTPKEAVAFQDEVKNGKC